MGKIHTLTLALVFLAFGRAGFTFRAHQPPSDLSIRIAGVDSAAFPQVALTVTVRDANGVPVPDLEASAFEVNEDRAPQARPISAVRTVTNADLPVSIVLVVDVSGSMAGKPLGDAQAAARAIVGQLGQDDQVAFLAFAGAVNLDGLDPTREHPLTTDRRVVEALIDGLKAGGGTPLYDALYKGVRWAEEATPGQRALILLTDSRDEEPGSVVASAETPIQEAARAGVPVFTIGLGTQIERGYLERVARSTGAVYQQAPDSASLTGLFLNVLARLKQQYVLTYESGLPADGETHRVSVVCRTGGKQASDEAEIGPLPTQPTPTQPPTDTPVPTDTPTATPSPTALPTLTSTPVLAEAAAPLRAEPTATATPTSSDRPAALPRWALALAGVGALALIALLASIAIRRRRRDNQEYCARCGRALAPGQVCPDCGPDAGRFRKPRGL